MQAYARGRRAREDEMRRLALWAVWHGAVWSRKKRLPDLSSILRKIGRRVSAKRTTDQLLRMAERLNALFGGQDERRKKDQ